MATTEFSILQTGTRVKVVRGSMPLEEAILGREGLVVDASQYRPHRYGVILDGETRVRYFVAEELEPGDNPRLGGEDREAAKKRLARP